MKGKLVLGIVMPIVVILILTLISNMGDAIIVEKTTYNEVVFNDLFDNQQSYSSEYYNIQNITLINDFFLPRKYEIPIILACLNDLDGYKEKMDLNLQYGEGYYNNNRYYFDKAFFGMDRYSGSAKTIDLDEGEKKMIMIKLQKQFFDYSAMWQYDQYVGYEEIILVELNDNEYRYRRCNSLTADEMENAIHIELLDLPGPSHNTNTVPKPPEGIILPPISS